MVTGVADGDAGADMTVTSFSVGPWRGRFSGVGVALGARGDMGLSVGRLPCGWF